MYLKKIIVRIFTLYSLFLTGVFPAVCDDALEITAPADLVISDRPNDNGGYVVAAFTVPESHFSTVKSYVFFRRIDLNREDENLPEWTHWAVVNTLYLDSDDKIHMIVPTVWDTVSDWKVYASTDSLSGDNREFMQSMELPVALIVYGSSYNLQSETHSVASNIATAASIDNIQPGAFISFDVQNTESSDIGINLSWTVPDDHGIFETTAIGDETFYRYGVETYVIYRKMANNDNPYIAVGSVGPLITSFADTTAERCTLYEYYVAALDSNPEHITKSTLKMAMVSTGLGDLVLLGSRWGLKKDDTNWLPRFDFNGDGRIGLGDLVIFGSYWRIGN